MSDIERETYLRRIRAKAWQAILAATGTPEQVFATAAEVYERELRSRMSLEGTAEYFRAISDAREAAYEVLDGMDPERPMAERLRELIAGLDEVLGPDLVREADPTGEVLKPLPYEQRKQMLDAVQQVTDERGGERPPMILIVEDEVGPVMEAGRKRRERDAAAERMSDYLTQLGVDPDETDVERGEG